MLLAAPGSASAGVPVVLDTLEVSADVPMPVAGVAPPSARLAMAANGTLLDSVALPGGLAASAADLEALAVRVVGGAVERWMVLDTWAAPTLSPALPPGQPFRCLDAGCTSLDVWPLPAPAEGARARVAAMAFDTNGDLLLSLETDAWLGAQAVARGQLVRCSGGSCALAVGAPLPPAGLHVDAIEVLPDGRWLLSFDAAGTVDGLAFADQDVLLHDPDGGSWASVLQPAQGEAGWEAANLDALALPPVLPDAIFKDGFEDPSPG